MSLVVVIEDLVPRDSIFMVEGALIRDCTARVAPARVASATSQAATSLASLNIRKKQKAILLKGVRCTWIYFLRGFAWIYP
jgi:hypothetical protein